MKNQKQIKHYIGVGVVALGLVLGASSLQAAWTTPTGSPPNGNVDAPINAGALAQQKKGQLSINTDDNPYAVGLYVFGQSIFNGALKIVDGTQGAGKILTSDANGAASWQTGGTGGTLTATAGDVVLVANTTVDGAWHAVSLSSSVPAGTTAVMLKSDITTNLSNGGSTSPHATLSAVNTDVGSSNFNTNAKVVAKITGASNDGGDGYNVYLQLEDSGTTIVPVGSSRSINYNQDIGTGSLYLVGYVK